MKVLILSGPNHKFDTSAEVINGFLSARDDLSVTLDDNKDVLTSDGLNDFDSEEFGHTKYERVVSSIDFWIGKILKKIDLVILYHLSKYHYNFFYYRQFYQAYLINVLILKKFQIWIKLGII